MKQNKETTSTEKLLDIIRKKTYVPKAGQGGAKSSPRIHGSRGRNVRKIPPLYGLAKKPLSVGVDIGRDCLRIIKVARNYHDASSIMEHKSVEIPRGLNRNSQKFVEFIKTEMNSFCDFRKGIHVWTIMSSANVEVHHVRIPNVPAKQIENVVHWTVKKESSFDEKESFLDFKVLGEVLEQGIKKLSVMFYIAPRREVEEIRRLFSRAGWPLSGLSITSFAVQNILRSRSVAEGGEPMAHLFIGNDFSRIDIYAEGNLVMTRDIKAGINSMLESLMEGFTGSEAQAVKNDAEHSPDMDRAKKVISALSPDSPSHPQEASGEGLTKDEIWDMILPALERLVRQVERTFEYFKSNGGNVNIRKIYVSTVTHIYPRIVGYVGEQLNIESDVFDPLTWRLSVRKWGSNAAASVSERNALAPAMGIALSDNRFTPNLIFTYREREREASVKRINTIIFATFMLSVVLCGFVFSYQLHALDERHKTILRLENKLSNYSPLMDRGLIMKTLEAVRQEGRAAKNYGRRYLGLAVISELSRLTSPNARLTKISARFSSRQGEEREVASRETEALRLKKPDEAGEIELEGFVLGDSQTLDTALASYALRLNESPLFEQVKTIKTDENANKSMAVNFIINLKLEGVGRK